MTIAGAGIFVKTIGMSPLKTRLAAGIGEERAHQFYRYSCGAVHEVLTHSRNVKPYWAVAEGKKAFNLWQGAKLEQGRGELGNRLSFVYDLLLEKHQFAVLLGGDAPQINSFILDEALELGEDGSFVIGPSLDGGFYLLLGSKPLPLSLWRRVPYSREDTRFLLIQELESQGEKVRLLDARADVDHLEDIPKVMGDLQQLVSATPAQKNLATWLEGLKSTGIEPSI